MSSDPAPHRGGDLLADEPERKGYLGYLLLVPFLVVAALVVMGVVGDPFLSDRPGGLSIGSAAPDLLAEGWLNGEAPTRAELRGQVLVIDAWASWCDPCREETPELVALHRKYGDRVVFVGLTAEPRSQLPKIERFLDQLGVTWLIGYGADATLEILEAEVIPMVWVVGRDGRIVWNRSSRKSLEEGIRQALGES